MKNTSSSSDLDHPPERPAAFPAQAPSASPRNPPGADKGEHLAAPAFPVVGLGASAGGLEALGAFFGQVPPDSGAAYVVVLHADPGQNGHLAEHLSAVAALPVERIKDRCKLQPNRVYVIPPDKDPCLGRHRLHLLDPAAPGGLRLPIDSLLRSLAAEMGEYAVAVILSGMGSDGVLGLRAIKEAAGACFVQDPATTRFGGMPLAGIQAGLADVVAPAERLPGLIAQYLKRLPRLAKAGPGTEDGESLALRELMGLLRASTGHDFSLYKKNSVLRRIERRMSLHKIEDLWAYVHFLRSHSREIELLLKELLIGVTSFFRDPPVWEQLGRDILPQLMSGRGDGEVLRVWTPGCSTGEEAYTLAMVFRESLERHHPQKSLSLQIFATDLDKDAIEKARIGVYPANIASDVAEERLNRFFVREEQGFRVSKEIREAVVFAPHNVIKDPPFTRMDLLVCRNLLIYFDQELQKKLLPLFHYSLHPGGVLLLGNAETVGSFTDLFIKASGRGRFYRTRRRQAGMARFQCPAAVPESKERDEPAGTGRGRAPNLQALADRLVLQRFARPAVFTSASGDIVYISGRTGRFLEPVAGKANWNIFAMARAGLRFELGEAYQSALRTKTPVTLRGMVVEEEDSRIAVDVLVQPLSAPEALSGMVVTVFNEVSAPLRKRRAGRAHAPVDDERLEDLRGKIKMLAEELLGAREQMLVSQEESRSANEELQSTNEELQLANEELTTSKEEMQSINEELQTVNSELQAKLEELSLANNDMKNLLDSTDIATLFLDEGLCVRRFTKRVTSIINLIPSDVGRPLTNLTSSLDYPDLAADAQEVLSSLLFSEKAVHTHEGLCYLVRIMPYRTVDNRIAGVVITFTDISVARNLEAALRESDRETWGPLRGMPLPFALFSADFDDDGLFCEARFVFANQAFAEAMGTGPHLAGQALGRGWPGLGRSQWELLARAASRGEPVAFESVGGRDGKRYACTAYRPGGGRDRLCVLLDPLNRVRAAKPVEAGEVQHE